MIVAILADRLSHKETSGTIRFIATIPPDDEYLGRTVVPMADIHVDDLRVDMGQRGVDPRLRLGR